MTEERTSHTFRFLDGRTLVVTEPVAATYGMTSRERLNTMPRSVLECLVPPLPRRLAAVMSLGTRREVER